MQERRRYIRISTVLPVEFFAIDGDKKRITPWLQGFTQDLSRGGICLKVNDLWQGFWDKVNAPGTTLSLKINLPFGKVITTDARFSWHTQQAGGGFTQYRIGLEFINARARDRDILFKYALFKRYVPVTVAAILATLILFSSVLAWKNSLLVKENRRLVKEYVRTIEENSGLAATLIKEDEHNAFLAKRYDEIREARVSLERQLAQAQRDYANVNDKETTEADTIKDTISHFKEKLSNLEKESALLKTKRQEGFISTAVLQNKANIFSQEQREISSKIISGLCTWIKNRQDLKQGLVISFEGDRNLEKICYTYDQALAAIVFCITDNRAGAERILNFYLRRVNRAEDIYNAYYSSGETAEYAVHSGPNAWIGLAVLDYTKKTGDRKFLPVAQKVAGMLTAMMDSEGGIKGGPKDDWYATEHNLDAFAFFKLYYEVTGDEQYLKSAEKIKDWIARYAYTTYGPVIKRGKGDSTVATDTYAWSVSTFGPETLISLHMNPEAILKFAIENCEVTTQFKRKEGEITVRGFDFAKAKNIARAGVISAEWTAQMILSFEIMAAYYREKDVDKYNAYAHQSMFYFNELQKMLITSPSRAGREDPCLPYASSALADTGHGWRTPNGDTTGSLASTSYFLIAYFGYNPFKGEFLNVSLKEMYEKRSPASTASAH